MDFQTEIIVGFCVVLAVVVIAAKQIFKKGGNPSDVAADIKAVEDAVDTVANTAPVIIQDVKKVEGVANSVVNVATSVTKTSTVKATPTTKK